MEFVDTNVQPKPQWLVEANGGKVRGAGVQRRGRGGMSGGAEMGE